MAFSQAFLEWEQATEQKGIQKRLEEGEKSIILRLLTRKIDAIAPHHQAIAPHQSHQITMYGMINVCNP